MRQEQFGQMWPLYQKLRDYLCSLGSPGFDVKEFAKVKSRNTFQVDFGGTFDPYRGISQDGFVEVRVRPKEAPTRLVLWVRLRPKQVDRSKFSMDIKFRGGRPRRFPVEVPIRTAAELDEIQPLLQSAYQNKKGEGHDNQNPLTP